MHATRIMQIHVRQLDSVAIKKSTADENQAAEASIDNKAIDSPDNMTESQGR
jgi:hypothetical protein